MRQLTWLGAGLAGGLLGAALWAVVVYFANFELGIIAWGIGVLAGLGVRAAAGDQAGNGSASMAVVAAIICIGIGKLGGVALMWSLAGTPTTDDAMLNLADMVAYQWERDGRTLRWPANQSVDTAAEQSDYPPDVWAEATQRWQAIPPEDQSWYLQDSVRLALLDTEYVVSFIADAVIDEYLKADRPLDYPPNADPVRPSSPGDYPANVWKDASARWDQMSAEERHTFQEQQVLPQLGAISTVSSASIIWNVTLSSLSLWDGLWALFAGITAWRLGEGG